MKIGCVLWEDFVDTYLFVFNLPQKTPVVDLLIAVAKSGHKICFSLL